MCAAKTKAAPLSSQRHAHRASYMPTATCPNRAGELQTRRCHSGPYHMRRLSTPPAQPNTPSWKPSSLSHCQETDRAGTGPWRRGVDAPAAHTESAAPHPHVSHRGTQRAPQGRQLGCCIRRRSPHTPTPTSHDRHPLGLHRNTHSSCGTTAATPQALTLRKPTQRTWFLLSK